LSLSGVSGEIMHKTCNKCKVEKEITWFSRNRTQRGGYEGQCKACRKIHIDKYHENCKLSYLKQKKQYRLANPHKIRALKAKRRAAKLEALPQWLTKSDHEEMKELYEIARIFKLYTGEEYHVDHIVPLQGENVCGLHVPWNLQVIPAKENQVKYNKLQEDIL
jgi:hypothetical protein